MKFYANIPRNYNDVKQIKMELESKSKIWCGVVSKNYMITFALSLEEITVLRKIPRNIMTLNNRKRNGARVESKSKINAITFQFRNGNRNFFAELLNSLCGL